MARLFLWDHASRNWCWTRVYDLRDLQRVLVDEVVWLWCGVKVDVFFIGYVLLIVRTELWLDDSTARHYESLRFAAVAFGWCFAVHFGGLQKHGVSILLLLEVGLGGALTILFVRVWQVGQIKPPFFAAHLFNDLHRIDLLLVCTNCKAHSMRLNSTLVGFVNVPVVRISAVLKRFYLLPRLVKLAVLTNEILKSFNLTTWKTLVYLNRNWHVTDSSLELLNFMIQLKIL